MITQYKNKFKYMLFSYEDFNQKSFLNFVMTSLYLNRTYTILVSLGFLGNSNFYMTGRQIGIKITDTHNLNQYENIYDVIMLRILDVMSKYDMSDMPNTVIIGYKEVNISKDLQIKDDIKNIGLNKSVNIKSGVSGVFNYLPLSIASSNLGLLLIGEISLEYLNKLKTNILNTGMDIPIILKNSDLINKSNIFIRDYYMTKNKVKKLLIIDCPLGLYNKNIKGNPTFYSYLESGKPYINKNNGFIRIVFDILTGICLCESRDIILNDTSFIRQIDNYILTITNNQISEINRYLKLDNIKPPKQKISFMSNPNIGVLDVETFVNSSGLGQVYCLGYGTLQDNSKITTFYLGEHSDNLNSNLLIIKCINSMLVPKYHNYYWYIHNMGKFDIIFIHKTLEEFNLNNKSEYYKLTTIFKEGKMLKLVVSCKISKNRSIKITFLDSYNILSSSLEKLTKDFKVECTKGIFPYSFVNETNLNYIGETPNIKYFNKISILDYNKIYTKTNWSLKLEALKYLEKDILGLLQVLDEFKKILFLEHNLELTEGLTISRLSLNKFLKYYLKDTKIPLINKLDIFNFIYSGYYGGRTEVFKPHGKNLYYYDVNSLYPHEAAFSNMPGMIVKYIKSFSENGLNIDNIFGVFLAKVKTNNHYLGLLPIKTKAGLIFPNGEYSGVWASPELKFAKENGYEITVLEGYNFNQVPSYFKEYVLDLYELKLNTTGTKKVVNKSLLNNILGRFGLNIIKPVTKLFNTDKLDKILTTCHIKSILEITSDKWLVNYIPIIDQEICIEHNVDYVKALTNNINNFNLEKNIDLFEDVSIIISALDTSYSRVFMLKQILRILKKGGNIYYMDTDSIVTDIPLDPEIVGEKIGQFKLEYVIKEGFFISNKTYCLILEDGSTVIKCKGVNQDSLTVEDFKEMYYSNKNVYANKTSAITNLTKGSVIIQEKKILVQSDGYLKREKLYNVKGLWVETKPLTYNNLNRSIVLYSNLRFSIIVYKKLNRSIIVV